MLKHPFQYALMLGVIAGLLSMAYRAQPVVAIEQALGTFVAALLILWAIRTLAAIWRAARRVSIESMAHRAGRISKAFKDGQRSS
jgi:xanthosine utilization system XapX-like protein